MKLTRRRFGVLVASGAVATTGCIDGNGEENGDDNGVGNGDDDNDENNDENGNDEPTTTEFRGHELPPLPARDRHVWYHDRSDASVYLEPSDETVEPPQDVEFTLRNESDDEVGINPYDWNVYKLYDGAWKLVKPRETPEPWEMVPPGESRSQTLEVSTDADEGDIALGDGIYGFYFGTRDYAAAFEVVDTELVVEPTDAVTRTERDGNVVTVYTTYYDEIEDHQTPGTLVVRRGDAVDAPAEPPEPIGFPRILLEQAANEEVLRNTLPYFEDGVDEVRLKIPTTHRGNLGVLLSGGVSGTTRYFVYEGEEHSVELVEEDDD